MHKRTNHLTLAGGARCLSDSGGYICIYIYIFVLFIYVMYLLENPCIEGSFNISFVGSVVLAVL